MSAETAVSFRDLAQERVHRVLERRGQRCCGGASVAHTLTCDMLVNTATDLMDEAARRAVLDFRATAAERSYLHLIGLDGRLAERLRDLLLALPHGGGS